MKRRRLLALGGIIVVVGVVTVPLVATAGDERRIVLTERMQLTGFDPATGAGTQAGSFVSAGAVNDAGAAVATFTLVAGSAGCGTLEGTHVFTGSGGTLSVHTEALACPFPPASPPRSLVRARDVGGRRRHRRVRRRDRERTRLRDRRLRDRRDHDRPRRQGQGGLIGRRRGRASGPPPSRRRDE
jgi:hypothetical protein